MSIPLRLFVNGGRVAAVASAVWAAQVQAGGTEIYFPRQQIIDDPRYSSHPQDPVQSEDLDATVTRTAPPRGRISFARDGQLVGPARYASRKSMGNTEIVVFVSSPPPQANVESGDLPTGFPAAGRLSSAFGYRLHPILGGVRWHGGIDIAAPMGTPVHATSDGRVEKANWNGGYGLMVELDDGGGTKTLYGHMSRLAVAKGDIVTKGEVLGYVGSTGLSTGPHVHYEIRQNGRSVDPADIGLAKRPSAEDPIALP